MDSISRGREQAIAALRAVPRNTRIVLFFGAIDTHYLTWRLHETTGAGIEEGLGRSVAGYCSSLDWLVDARFLVHAEEHHLSNPAAAPLWVAGIERTLDS